MATAKKAAVKKLVRKPVIAKKVAVKEIPAVAVEDKAAPASKAVRRKAGRPVGSKARKTAGRPPSTEFLYALRPVTPVDDMGLDIGATQTPVAVDIRGPFPSEDAAQAAAIEEIGTDTTLEVTLFKDYKRGRPEIKVRLV